jgi:hypothetical protein
VFYRALSRVKRLVVNYIIFNNIVLFRSVTIIYIYYFYLIGIEVIPNLTIITIVLLYIHSLYKRLTLLITTTLLFSN